MTRVDATASSVDAAAPERADQQDDPMLKPLSPDAQFRFAQPGASALETAVADANERLFADARDRLDQQVPGVIEALERSTSKRVVEVVGDVRDLPELDDLWDAVEELLARDDATPANLSISAADPAADEIDLDVATTYALSRPDLQQLAKVIGSGSAVLIQGVNPHVPALDRLLGDLTAFTGQPARADVVLCHPDAAHVEPLGRRSETLLLVGIDDGLEIDKGGTTHRVSRGHAVVITADGSAKVQPNGSVRGTSLFLRIAIPTTTIADLMRFAWTSARYHPLLRADLPTRLDRPVVSYAGSIVDDPDLLRSELDVVLGERGMQRAVAGFRAMVPARRRLAFSIAYGFCDRLPERLRSCVPAGLMLVDTDRGTRIGVSGMLIDVDESDAETLAAVLDNRAFNTASVVDRGGVSSEIFRSLYLNGLLEPA